MANTFVIYDCKRRKNILITPSARKARDKLYVGAKIEVWNDNKLIETIYVKNVRKIDKYVGLQKQYIGIKQAKAEERNKRRKNHG